MLGNFIIIDNVQFPNPVTGTFSTSLHPEENTFMTEAGTQVSNVVRLDRGSWSATFNCSASLKDRLIAVCKKALCEVEINGVSAQGRLRLSGEVTLVANSERSPETDGLWVVPVTFEEF